MESNKKELPIRIFFKRKQDDRLTEGGGGGNEPKWVKNSIELEKHASSLTEAVIEIQKSQDIPKAIPSVIDVSLINDAIAKSHRSTIENFFMNFDNEPNLIELKSSNDLLFSVKDNGHFEKIKNNFLDTQFQKKAISAIEKITPFTPYIDDKSKESNILKIKLIKFNNKNFDGYTRENLLDFCKIRNIEVKEKKYTKNLVIYRIENFTDEYFNELVRLDGLASIEPMPSVSIDLQTFSEASKIRIKSPTEGKQYPTIGILDSGISMIPHLNPWVVGKHSPYPEDDLDKNHGTFCSGIVLYGNELQGLEESDLEGCYIFDASVIPKVKIHEDELLDNIRETLEKYSEKVKIWNMSLGIDKEIDSNYFSDFGKALDELQNTLDIIIVKSAGNCGNFLDSLPPSRVSIPGDSVNALVVGSIAHTKGPHDLSDVNHRSPFSKIGPGPGYITKPELVHYGGNAHGDSNGKLVSNGVSSFGASGKLATHIGTSFSAPRVAARLAHLNNTISDSEDLLLLKTLLIHSSTYPENVQIKMKEKVKELGFGLPAEINNILFNDQHEISLVYRDELPKGKFIEMLDFPFPENLIDQEFFRGQIAVTLCTKPILSQNQGREYIQSDLKIGFGTYSNLLERDVLQRGIRNPIGRENTQNILLNNLYSRKSSKRGLRETSLIQNEEKFHPIKKYIVNLEEMTNANKTKHLVTNKKWFLKLEGLFRHYIETTAQKLAQDLSIPFCLIITIKDPNKKENVYDQVSQQLTNRQFIHNPISIKTEVGIRV